MSALHRLNEILAATGQEPTSVEECERLGVDLSESPAEIVEPWSWEFVRDNFSLLNIDLARDIARGK